ncbi:hypothetical protein DB41_CS00050 [Neochlamydia sp. TUME1]|uniref:hypothetical protein n=1 Tax=Neochlamydia sp. TUME1 TaxID=1478174 RepID=UPI00057EC08B|nr:hypothetical protein [Neochlamydia sp. TUME1]KIC77198.1 hypothetical protein DB41_CS00050 [Neochlamydia sp. TUME1]
MNPTLRSEGSIDPFDWSSLLNSSSSYVTGQATTGNSNQRDNSSLALQNAQSTAVGSQTSLPRTAPDTINTLSDFDWAALGQLTFTDSHLATQLTQQSHNYLGEVAHGKGALSIETHREQMQVVEDMLNDLVQNTKNTTNIIIRAIGDFAQKVQVANHQISNYCLNILKRGMDDPTLTTNDIIKAKLIIEFSATSVGVMKNSSEAAIDLAGKGGGIINQQTLATLKAIFEVRGNQVALLSQKLQVFQQQEQHNLDLILKIQDIKLKEQAQLFNQLKEIIHLREEEKDGNTRRELEVRKAALEAQIQIRGQWLKEEEANNKYQLEAATISNKYQIDKEALRNAREIEEQLTAIKAAEQKDAAANQKLEIQKKAENEGKRIKYERDTNFHQTNIQGRVASQKNELDAEVQRNQIAASERNEHFKTFASIVKPPCVLQ